MVRKTLPELDDFCLPRLFSIHNYDHLPLDEQVLKFKRRDLSKSYLFVTARKCFGTAVDRKRVFEVTGGGVNKTEVERLFKDCPVDDRRGESERTKKSVFQQTASDPDEHEMWLADRRRLREMLDDRDIVENFLRNKPTCCAIEKKMVKRFNFIRYPPPPPKTPTPEPEIVTSNSPPPDLVLPAPAATHSLAELLKSHRLRLMDVFRAADKEKSWKLNKQELKAYFKEAAVDISDVQLEELIIAVDSDYDDRISYHELASAMSQLRLEQTSDARSSRRRRDEEKSPVDLKQMAVHERLSRAEAASQDDGTRLYPPGPDLRLEQHILENEEAMLDLRKRNRYFLAKMQGSTTGTTKLGKNMRKSSGKLKKQLSDRDLALSRGQPDEDSPLNTVITLDPRVDAHVAVSTLSSGPVVAPTSSHCDDETALSSANETAGDSVNEFRQRSLQHFYDVGGLLSHDEGKYAVQRATHTLEKGLLHPGDLPRSLLRERLRERGQQVQVDYNARSPEEEARIAQRKLDAKVAGGFDPFAEPPPESVRKRAQRQSQPFTWRGKTKPKKQKLSTGPVNIEPSIDCWYTADQFGTTTAKMDRDFAFLKPGQNNPTWPDTTGRSHIIRPSEKAVLSKTGDYHGAPSLFAPTNGGNRPRLPYSRYNSEPKSYQVNDRNYLVLPKSKPVFGS